MNQIAANGRGQPYEIYQKRYFNASPTGFTWNHLTALDVRSLREEPGFEGQQIYFHLNHPIQFVCLVGLLVDVKIFSGKRIILALDDGSGASVEVKTELRAVRPGDNALYPSNTVVDNLDVKWIMNVEELSVDKTPVPIGTCIKVKGTIDTFRNERQLKLERIRIVPHTAAEVRAWEETALWKCDVLSKPWVLTHAQRQEIDARLLNQERREREREREKMALEAKKKSLDAEHEAKKLRHLKKKEIRRRAEEVVLNHGALPGTSLLPGRVTDS